VSLATIVAAPMALFTALYGGRYLLKLTMKKPLMGLALVGASAGAYAATPGDIRMQIEDTAQEVAAAPAEVTDLFGDLVRIVKDGNEQVADAASYADEELTDLYTHETDRYGGTYQRIMDRILVTLGDDAVVMEDTGYADGGYDPYPGGV